MIFSRLLVLLRVSHYHSHNLEEDLKSARACLPIL